MVLHDALTTPDDHPGLDRIPIFESGFQMG